MIFVVVLSLMLLHMAMTTQHIPKLIGRVLELPPCSNCPDSCLWSHYGKPVPHQWIQSNGDLLLPANNWSAFGAIASHCEDGTSVNYDITNPGKKLAVCHL